ncbi:MAG: alpha/beta fold hydrolase [Chitinophagaceae bacterium]
MIKKILSTTILIILALSLYANFIHTELFSTRNELSDLDTTSYEKGIPISFKSSKYILKGNLLAPKTPGKKFPVIIFSVGSAISSYASNYTKFLDSLFEKNLPMDSVALLYFDKRGIGQSEGKWFNTSFEERAADVKAAADYLKTLSNIDTNKIAIVGHSQGGWIVQICLAKYPETFVGGISMAGPTFSVKKQLINDYQTKIICVENLDSIKANRKAEKNVRRDLFFTSLFPFKENWKQLKVIKRFEPGNYLKKIKQPILLMFAENDALVYPNWCLKELSHVFPDGLPYNFDTMVIKGVNHGFMISSLCYKGSFKTIPYADDCKKAILNWTRQILLK